VSWHPPFDRWLAARQLWMVEHPDCTSLGNAMDRIRVEFRTRREWMRRNPLGSVGPVQVRDGVIVAGVIDPVTGGLRGRLPGEELFRRVGSGFGTATGSRGSSRSHRPVVRW
jgi:hypothetical protein